jgi:hypothetical protein
MIITRVQYTVRQEYVEQNKANIRRVIAAVSALAHPDISYSVFIEEDGKTFVHLPVFANEVAQKEFSQLESFTTFRSELKASQPEVPPLTTKLSLIGSSGAFKQVF